VACSKAKWETPCLPLFGGAQRDLTSGAGDGKCDAANIHFGMTTASEMFFFFPDIVNTNASGAALGESYIFAAPRQTWTSGNPPLAVPRCGKDSRVQCTPNPCPLTRRPSPSLRGGREVFRWRCKDVWGRSAPAMNNFIIGTKLHRLGLCLAESANHWPQFWGVLLLLRTYRLG